MAEKSANSVSAYGGLGAHGLDFGEEGAQGACKMQKELEGSFSISALKFAPKIQMEGDYSYLLDDGKQSQESDLREEVEEIEDVILDDSANYKVPESDDGYYTVLKERFGHEEFKEG